MNRALFYLWVLIILVSFISCSRGKEKRRAIIQPEGEKAVIRAERFTLSRTDSCTVLTIINPWQGAEKIEQVYYLVEKGRKISIGADSGSVIHVPVERIICMSTTHLAMIKALGMEDAIAGVSGAGYIYDKGISEKVRRGMVSDVGYEAGLNSELIVKCAPDLVMMYGIGSESVGYVSRIRELGIKVMFNADYLENDPLAKAEWIKLFGALFCKEDLADTIFNSASRSYNQLRAFISQNTVNKPVVMLGMPFRDTWFISPGNSFVSKLIEDAGGEYLWKNTKSSSSMPYSLEKVYMQALKADYWLNTGTISSKNEITSLDPRFLKLSCYRTGNIFNNNKRLSPGGGNDYWESGVVSPQVILKDIASILHPGLFGDYEPVYYTKIK
jgi:iron complex transport system substrate-binding protein